jgi:hypothetical protein
MTQVFTYADKIIGGGKKLSNKHRAVICSEERKITGQDLIYIT